MKKFGKRLVAALLLTSIFTVLLYNDFCQAVTVYASEDSTAYSVQKAGSQGNALLDNLTTDAVEPIREIKNDQQPKRTAEDEMVESAENSMYQEVMSKVSELFSTISENSTDVDIQKGFKGISKYFDVLALISNTITVADDMAGMNDLQNESTGWRLAEALALWADAVIAFASAALAFLGLFMGALASWWVMLLLAILAFILGLLSSYWHSEDFAKRHDPDGYTRTPDGVNAKKPNLYIYYADTGPIQVRFDHPELLVDTIPDYGSGWNVTNLGNGQLAAADGTVYGYLFYESATSKSLFQTEAGYRIPAGQREEIFREILGSMGFNGQEIDDFVEYWCEKLAEGVDYVMYPQDKERVDLAMPLVVTPEPVYMERLWFAFKKDVGQQVEEPEPIVLRRDEVSTVIEWGGMVFDEEEGHAGN